MGSSLVAPTQHSASSVAAIVAALSNLDLNVSSGNGKVSFGTYTGVATRNRRAPASQVASWHDGPVASSAVSLARNMIWDRWVNINQFIKMIPTLLVNSATKMRSLFGEGCEDQD
jgi:hypothetical protein